MNDQTHAIVIMMFYIAGGLATLAVASVIAKKMIATDNRVTVKDTVTPEQSELLRLKYGVVYQPED